MQKLHGSPLYRLNMWYMRWGPGDAKQGSLCMSIKVHVNIQKMHVSIQKNSFQHSKMHVNIQKLNVNMHFFQNMHVKEKMHVNKKKIACQHAKISCQHEFFSEHACQIKFACQRAAHFPDGWPRGGRSEFIEEMVRTVIH